MLRIGIVLIILSILDSVLKFCGKNIVHQLFLMSRIDTDPDGPDPDQHALVADPDPDIQYT